MVVNNFGFYLLFEEAEVAWVNFGFQLSGKNRGSQTVIKVRLSNYDVFVKSEWFKVNI